MSIVKDLSSVQARVIGALIEKSITTPEQYPLSLNSLTAACNQKSNREPVMSLNETQVQETIDELTQKRLVSTESGFGSRVSKYKHRFCNTQFSELQLSEAALAVICVMLLRGAQTPGELRTRTQRLYDFNNVEQLEDVLQQLMDDDKGPFVAKSPREPGKRECRYIELFSAEAAQAEIPGEVRTASPHTENDDRIELLEMQFDELQQELTIVKQKLNQLLGDE